MNKYDSSKIIAYLLKYFNNFIITKNILKSDFIILNTCSVRQKAQNKLLYFFDKIKKVKIINPNLIVAVGGCIAVQEKEKLFLKFNLIDIIFGTHNIKKLPFLIKNFQKNKNKIIYVKFTNKINKNINSINYYNSIISKSFVSIMEGCNKFCSYCIVPFLRGKEISRTPEDIINEIYNIVNMGIVEINLLGQNVNAYSSFFNNGKKCNFSNLLYLISEIDNVKRIRFTTSHPSNFNNDLITAYKNISKIVDFLHLPVQSGSDRILKIMKRNYTINDYKKIIDNLLNIRPNMIFGSDFIVGFPTENKDDFNLTLKLIYDIKFDSSYSFIYSPRPGTKSFYMKDNISIFEKKNRLYKLQKLLYDNSVYWNNILLNSIQEIIVEGISKRNNFYYGRSRNNKIIYFKSGRNLLGKLLNIKVNLIKNNCLYGKLI